MPSIALLADECCNPTEFASILNTDPSIILVTPTHLTETYEKLYPNTQIVTSDQLTPHRPH